MSYLVVFYRINGCFTRCVSWDIAVSVSRVCSQQNPGKCEITLLSLGASQIWAGHTGSWFYSCSCMSILFWKRGEEGWRRRGRGGPKHRCDVLSTEASCHIGCSSNFTRFASNHICTYRQADQSVIFIIEAPNSIWYTKDMEFDLFG